MGDIRVSEITEFQQVSAVFTFMKVVVVREIAATLPAALYTVSVILSSDQSRLCGIS